MMPDGFTQALTAAGNALATAAHINAEARRLANDYIALDPDTAYSREALEQFYRAYFYRADYYDSLPGYRREAELAAQAERCKRAFPK